MTDIVHTSDSHLGYQQYNRPERKADFLEAFTHVTDGAIENNVSAIVHGGDLFHKSTVGTETLMVVVDQLKRLQEHDIRFLSVVGNHDMRHSDTQWLDLLESIGLVTRLGTEPVSIGDTSFYGLDHQSASQRSSQDYKFSPHQTEYAVLVAHGLFAPLAVSDWDAAEVLSKSNISFDAMLLGDDHEPKSEVINDTVVSYAGSTERTAVDQRKPRGFNLVTVGTRDTPPVDITREPITTRQFIEIDVTLEDGDDEQTVLSELDSYDVSDAAVFIRIDGEGDPVTPSVIEETALDNGALLCRTKDLREFSTETDTSAISFADPEAAAQEQVDEMNLSQMAEKVESMFRGGDVPPTRVADETESRVADTIAESPSEFVRPETPHSPSDEEVLAEPEEVTESHSETSEQSSEQDSDGSKWNTFWDGDREDIDSEDDSVDVEIEDDEDSEAQSSHSPSDEEVLGELEQVTESRSEPSEQNSEPDSSASTEDMQSKTSDDTSNETDEESVEKNGQTGLGDW